jgi:hypothetical protein
VEFVEQEPDHVQIDFTTHACCWPLKTVLKERKSASGYPCTFHPGIAHHFADAYISLL